MTQESTPTLKPYLSEEIIPDLNNIVRAIEDEGDRCYLGSTNDADRLREIADWLETKFRRTPPASQSEALVEIARLVRDRLEDGGGCVDGPDWDWDVDECAKVADDVARAILPILKRELTEAKADAERLAEAGSECADSLEEYAQAQWGFDERLSRQLKRDMQPVVDFRAALASYREKHNG